MFRTDEHHEFHVTPEKNPWSEINNAAATYGRNELEQFAF